METHDIFLFDLRQQKEHGFLIRIYHRFTQKVIIIYNTPLPFQEQKIATLEYVLNRTRAYITDNKRLKEMDWIKIITVNN